MSVNGQLTRKAQIGGRIETTAGTAETLAAQDFKTRLYAGANPEYNAERTERDIVRPTLTNIGSIEGKKNMPIGFRTEVNTPDAFNITATSSMDV